jgi:hypothetical protein
VRRLLPALSLVVLLACAVGCAGIAESLIDDGVHAACGESARERRDRQALDANKAVWATPGRTDHEIDTEARGTFRRANGREPNLNWSAR